jgi:hypothetical protein
MTPAPEGFVYNNYFAAACVAAAAAGFTEALVDFTLFLCFFTFVVDLVVSVVGLVVSCFPAPKAEAAIIERASTAVIAVFMAV